MIILASKIILGKIPMGSLKGIFQTSRVSVSTHPTGLFCTLSLHYEERIINDITIYVYKTKSAFIWT